MSMILSTLDIVVRWRDLDAFNHVNNASYLSYVEEARICWFKSLDENWDSADASPILAAVTMNYRRPVAWPETVSVQLSVQRIGNKSLTVEHRILSASAAETLYADGNTVMVWVDGSGQSIPLPGLIRSACS